MIFAVCLALAFALGCWAGWKLSWRKAVRANLRGIEIGGKAGPTYEAAIDLYQRCLQWADELDVDPPKPPSGGEP